MPDDQNVAVSPARAFQQEIDSYAPSFAQALPAHVSVEKFKRVLLTAVSQNPALFYANRRTLFNAAVRCASDGLIPDGREAALVVYKTKMKRRNPQTGLDIEESIEAVQYMPMVAGIRKRMRNTGDVLSADAHVVYENDSFTYKLGDHGFIDHEPAGLSANPGKPLGAYAIIKLKSGEVLRDVMRLADIERTRSVSRAKDGPMWTKWWDEAARKTVLRRCAKAAPQSAELESLLTRDEEEPAMMPAFDAMPPLALEPRREDFADERQRRIEEPLDERPEFAVIDNDGVEHIYSNGETAAEAIAAVLREAARSGLSRLDGAWDSNMATVDALTNEGCANASAGLAAQYEEMTTNLTSRPAQPVHERVTDGLGGPVSAGEEAQGSPLASATAGPSIGAPAPEQAHSAPADAGTGRPFATTGTEPSGGDGGSGGNRRKAGGGPTATSAASPSERPLPGDMPASERKSATIPVPVGRGVGGKPDLRTWSVALFAPKLRRQRLSNDLADLIGDNEETLAACRAPAALNKEDLADLEQSIKDQWRLVENG